MGQELAPAAFRAAGLVDRMRETALDVLDLGDLPVVPFVPDAASPRTQNLASALSVARQVADRVDDTVAAGRLPLILGGDCTLSLGVIAGLRRHYPGLGLLYFDGDVDLNTPETTSTGILDGMVIAHILGRGEPELARIGSQYPLLDEEQIVLFGFDPGSGWIDRPELELLKTSSMAQYPLERVRGNSVALAKQALEDLEGRSEAILVHFDIDVTDLPAADVPHPRGLDLDTALAALEVFVRSPRCAAVVVTEFNVQQDPDGSQAALLVEGLANVLGARAETRP